MLKFHNEGAASYEQRAVSYEQNKKNRIFVA